MRQKIPWKHRSEKMPLSEEKEEQEIAGAEPETEAEVKKEAGSETEAKAEDEAEPETEAKVKDEAGPETEAKAEDEAVPETEAEVKKEAGPETEAEVKDEAEPETNAKAEEELEAEAEPETKSAKKMHVPGLVLNAVFLILNGFALAMIICLFLMQPHPGEKVKPTLDRFTTNAQDYYKDGETYHQVNANVKSYHSSGSTESSD
ncbi:MAG: hypothetical protein SOT28_07210 [Fusicatenibacter sp.]|nr:hypothetical protein [Fusicatenibacter sp.]